jgi:hypothetical protein
VDVSAAGDLSGAAGAGLPWTVTNQLLWVMDDALALESSPPRDNWVLTQARRANPFLDDALVEGRRADATVLLPAWLTAWRRQWAQDRRAVVRFLDRCAVREQRGKAAGGEPK